MVAVAILIGLIVISVVIGFLATQAAVRLERTGRGHQWLKIQQFATAILAGLGIAFGLSGVQLIFPVSDGPEFLQRDGVALSRRTIDFVQHTICYIEPNKYDDCAIISNSIVRTVNVGLSYPLYVPVQQDFVVELSASSTSYGLGNGSYSASLFLPKHIEGRTTQPCPANTAIAPTEVPACDSYDGGARPVQFSWEITPTKTGRALLSVKADMISKLPGFGGMTIRTDQGTSTREITYDQHSVSFDDLEVNVSRSEVRFPVEVLTTLGVSQKTYDWIKLAGAVVGALGTLLGAGFALKFVRRNSAEPQGPG